MSHWETVLAFAPNTLRAQTDVSPTLTSKALDFFNPDTVNLGKTTGGFNAVVQVSSACGLRLFHESTFRSSAIGETMRLPLGGSELAVLFASSTGPFASPLLNALRQSGTTPPAYDLWLTPVPVSLVFTPNDEIVVRYDIFTRLAAPEAIGTFTRRPQAFTPAIASSSASTLTARTELSGALGSFRLTITAPFDVIRNDAQTTIDIRSPLLKATVAVDFGSGDLNQLRSASTALAAFDWQALVRGFRTIRVLPPVSLVGTAYQPVTEFTDYDVNVFPVVDSLERQALAFAFDVRKGCHGTVESVEHFIGGSDFGCIYDEFVVQQSLRYRFRLFDFPRQLPLSAPMELERNGQPVGATVRGLWRFTTLEFSAVEFSANAGTQILKVGGRAVIDQVSAQLDDGTSVAPNQIDFGDGTATNWMVVMAPQLQSTPSAVPMLQPFQTQLEERVWQPLAKPFAIGTVGLAGRPQPVADYIRLWTIPAHLYVLGSIPDDLVPLISVHFLS